MISDQTVILLCAFYAFAFFAFGMFFQGWMSEDELTKVKQQNEIYTRALRHAIKEADDWAFEAHGLEREKSLDKYRELIK